MKNRNVCAGLCALILLFGLVGSSCQKPEEESYLPVYVDPDYSYMGDSLSVSFDGMMYPDQFGRPTTNTIYHDENVPETRTEIINGREVTLHYVDSMWYFVTPADGYVNEEEDIRVYFSQDTDEILLLMDHTKMGVSQKSEEELIKTGTEFAESKWPVFRDKNYTVSKDVWSGTSYAYDEVVLRRSFDGLITDESVTIWLSPEGEVVGWKSVLRYPDGAPEGMDQRAADLKGRDIFVKSAVHFLREQATKSGKKVSNIGKSWYSLVYGQNGELAVRVYIDVCDEHGCEITYSFIIPVPDSLDLENIEIETDAEEEDSGAVTNEASTDETGAALPDATEAPSEAVPEESAQ